MAFGQYRAVINNLGTLSELPFSSLEISWNVTDFDSFSMTLPNTNRVRTILNLLRPIVILRDNTRIFSGIITSWDYNRDTITIQGFSSLIRTLWALHKNNGSSYATWEVGGYRGLYDSSKSAPPVGTISIELILSEIISNVTGVSYGSVDELNLDLYMRFEYNTCMDAIRATCLPHKYEFWTDADDQFFAGTRGSNKTATVRLLYGRDILSSSRKYDGMRIVNKVHALGAFDGVAQIAASTDDADSIAEYGQMEGVLIEKEYEAEDLMTLIATNAVSEKKDPFSSYSVTFVQKPKNVSIGDTIYVQDESCAMDSAMRVKRLTVSVSPGSEQWSGELANVMPRFTAQIASMLSRIGHIDISSMGAMNFINPNNAENADATHGCKTYFTIPENAIPITTLVSFNIENYRASAFNNYAYNRWGEFGVPGPWATTDIAMDFTAHTLPLGFAFSMFQCYVYHDDPVTDHWFHGTIWNVTDGEWYSNFPSYLSPPNIVSPPNVAELSQVIPSWQDCSGDMMRLRVTSVPAMPVGSSLHMLWWIYSYEKLTLDDDTAPSGAETVSLEYDGVNKDAQCSPPGPWGTSQTEIDCSNFVDTTGEHYINLVPNERVRLDTRIECKFFVLGRKLAVP